MSCFLKMLSKKWNLLCSIVCFSKWFLLYYPLYWKWEHPFSLFTLWSHLLKHLISVYLHLLEQLLVIHNVALNFTIYLTLLVKSGTRAHQFNAIEVDQRARQCTRIGMTLSHLYHVHSIQCFQKTSQKPHIVHENHL